MSNILLLSGVLAAISSSSGSDFETDGTQSEYWKKQGLTIMVDDTVARLDSVGPFAIAPGLLFSSKGLEDRHGAPLPAYRPEVPGSWSDTDARYFVLDWGNGAVLVLAPYANASLDPRTGTLHLGGLLLETGNLEESRLKATTTRPRIPQDLEWRGGRWTGPVRFPGGADAQSLAVRLGKEVAILPWGGVELKGDRWDLGKGRHPIQWLTGRVDTLIGSLSLMPVQDRNPASSLEDSLEEPMSRIIGFGGGGYGGRGDAQEEFRNSMRRLSLSEAANRYALAGRGVWVSGRGRRGRYDGSGVMLDTARFMGSRVLDARVDAQGDVLSGTLLDTLAMSFEQGLLVSGPGTRIVRGLPALGGSGIRMAEVDLRSSAFRSLDASQEATTHRLTAEGTWSRTAIVQSAVKLRWGGVEIEGQLALVRDETAGPHNDWKGKDRFLLKIQSATAKIAGLRDTTGALAEVVADSLSQELVVRESSWSMSRPGPWRQWRDENRKWITYRFRPRLGFSGDAFYVAAESLQVSWSGSTFKPAPRSAAHLFDAKGFRARDRETGVLTFAAPAEAVHPTPWPGLGKFQMDSIELGRDDKLVLVGWLTPGPGWTRCLGDAPVRSRLEARVASDSAGLPHVSVQVGSPVALFPSDGQILPKLGARLLVPGDSMVLSSGDGRLVFSRSWDDPVLEGPVMLGRPAGGVGESLLRSIAWVADSLGAPISLREEWEPLERPLRLALPDKSELRASAPLAVRWTTDSSGIVSTRLLAPGLVQVRKGRAWKFPSDSLVVVGADGRPVLPSKDSGTFPSPLAPRDGRVVLPVSGVTLAVDRVEVSWKKWNACVEAGGCKSIPLDSCRKWVGTSRREDSIRARRFDSWRALPEMPATCVLEEEAEAYCKWAHGRLPTHKEFYAVAQQVIDSIRNHGKEPWPINTWWNIDSRWRPDGQDPFPDMAPPGSLRPAVQGLYDLAGNAEEWCTDKEMGDREKGGIYFSCTQWSSGKNVRTSRRRPERIGFRCVE